MSRTVAEAQTIDETTTHSSSINARSRCYICLSTFPCERSDVSSQSARSLGLQESCDEWATGGDLLNLASLAQLNPTPKIERMETSQPDAEPCDNPPHHPVKQQDPKTPGIEAQTIDTQGTGFNSSRPLKDAAVRNNGGPRIHGRASGRSL